LFTKQMLTTINNRPINKLVGAGEASKVGAYTFLIPLIAIIVSSIFLHEAITMSLFIGLLFIVVSICFVNIKPKTLAVRQQVEVK
ncbi:EamA family transporter, partial [Bacillus sp. D-CC]